VRDHLKDSRVEDVEDKTSILYAINVERTAIILADVESFGGSNTRGNTQ